MNNQTAAAAFILISVLVTLACLLRAASKPTPPPRHPLYDGPCPAGQAARYGDCWACMNKRPHPSPAVCGQCGQPPETCYHGRGPVWCWFCGLSFTESPEIGANLCGHRDNPSGVHQFVKVRR